MKRKWNLKLLNKVFGVGGRDEDVALVWLNEAIIHCFVYECQEEVVVPVHIQQPHLRAFHFHVTLLTYNFLYKKLRWENSGVVACITGLLWIPSWAHAITSKSSSNVP